jgi:hypothetical protein
MDELWGGPDPLDPPPLSTPLDDILIPARSVDETMSILRRVLEIFRANGLTLKLSKCSFLQTSIEYLGYEISGSEIRPTSHKIKAVRDFSD